MSEINEFVERAFARAAELESEDAHIPALCQFAELVPQYYRNETDSAVNDRLREHLKSCENCNLLLMALAAQSPPERHRGWIRDGARFILDEIIELWDLAERAQNAAAKPAAVYRGGSIELSSEKLTMPDGGVLELRLIQQEDEMTLIVTSENGARRFDAYTESGDILKSADNSRRFKLDIGLWRFTVVVDENYAIKFDGGKRDG